MTVGGAPNVGSTGAPCTGVAVGAVHGVLVIDGGSNEGAVVGCPSGGRVRVGAGVLVAMNAGVVAVMIPIGVRVGAGCIDPVVKVGGMVGVAVSPSSAVGMAAPGVFTWATGVFWG